MKYSEDKTKEEIEKIANKMNLSKKVESVKYVSGFLHYSISFDDKSSATVPRKHIDDYFDSEGKDGEHEIMNCLSVSTKFF